MEELITILNKITKKQKVTKYNQLLINQSIKWIKLSPKKVSKLTIQSIKIKRKENISDSSIKFIFIFYKKEKVIQLTLYISKNSIVVKLLTCNFLTFNTSFYD